MTRCPEIQEYLYEYLTGRLPEDDQPLVTQHLATCDACQQAAHALGHTLRLLDQAKPPPLSANFTASVLKQVRARPWPSASFWQRLTDRFQFPAFVWGGKGFAAIMMLLVAATLLRPYIAPRPTGQSKEMNMDIAVVPAPLRIETDDPEQALDKLKILIAEQQGEVLQTLWVQNGIQVIVKLKPETETTFLKQLHSLGKMEPAADSFKDTQSNLVVLLYKNGIEP